MSKKTGIFLSTILKALLHCFKVKASDLELCHTLSATTLSKLMQKLGTYTMINTGLNRKEWSPLPSTLTGQNQEIPISKKTLMPQDVCCRFIDTTHFVQFYSKSV